MAQKTPLYPNNTEARPTVEDVFGKQASAQHAPQIVQDGEDVLLITHGRPLMRFPFSTMQICAESVDVLTKEGQVIAQMPFTTDAQDSAWTMTITGITLTPCN